MKVLVVTVTVDVTTASDPTRTGIDTNSGREPSTVSSAN